MNKLTILKSIAKFNNFELADAIGVDVLTVALFERNIAPINYSIAQDLCEVLGAGISDLFPSLKKIISDVENSKSEEDTMSIMQSSETISQFINAGIDLDERDWIMSVTLTSGAERRYRLPSIEMQRVKDILVDKDDNSDYLSFYADCQEIIIRKRAIKGLSFLSDASYAAFKSDERGALLTTIPLQGVKPEFFQIANNSASYLRGLLEIIKSNEPLPPFFKAYSEDEDETYISVFGLDVLEIPMGLIVPNIYNEIAHSTPSKLELMDAVGSA